MVLEHQCANFFFMKTGFEFGMGFSGKFCKSDWTSGVSDGFGSKKPGVWAPLVSDVFKPNNISAVDRVINCVRVVIVSICGSRMNEKHISKLIEQDAWVHSGDFELAFDNVFALGATDMNLNVIVNSDIQIRVLAWDTKQHYTGVFVSMCQMHRTEELAIVFLQT